MNVNTYYFLVVSPNKKRAAMLSKSLAKYLLLEDVRFRVVETGRYYIIDIGGYRRTVIRFVSERQFYEASTGFHGWVVDEQQVEEWLDAAEKGEEV